MSTRKGRMPAALASDVAAPRVWLSAVLALIGLVVAASVAAATGVRDVALAAGYVRDASNVAIREHANEHVIALGR
ncbi:hypothetical protein OMK64_04865 [Cellulomonas fimi]|uniref:hypothetical protein n=1 Tax=Cellulomonas fimi TaxID=1708 RepID=UPI00234CE007|nr:hypothetical protein [Cellulomonas fimi]MDC7120859.1 hypothetical protein [Cellulomonas fimi]